MGFRVIIQLILLGICAIILVLAASLEVTPDSTDKVNLGGWTLPELCQSKRIFGIDCPGCGLTRSFIFMAHGEASAAFSIHPTGALMFVGVVIAIPFLATNAIWIYRGNRSLVSELGISVIVLVVTVMIAVQWIFRLVT